MQVVYSSSSQSMNILITDKKSMNPQNNLLYTDISMSKILKQSADNENKILLPLFHNIGRFGKLKNRGNNNFPFSRTENRNKLQGKTTYISSWTPSSQMMYFECNISHEILLSKCQWCNYLFLNILLYGFVFKKISIWLRRFLHGWTEHSQKVHW
jgi:hypothetical protein